MVVHTFDYHEASKLPELEVEIVASMKDPRIVNPAEIEDANAKKISSILLKAVRDAKMQNYSPIHFSALSQPWNRYPTGSEVISSPECEFFVILRELNI